LKLAEEAARFGVWEVDTAAGTMSLSEGMLPLLQLPAGSPMKVGLDEFARMIDPRLLSPILDAVNRAAAEHVPLDIEFPFFTKDGSIKWQHVQGTVELRDGQPQRITGATM